MTYGWRDELAPPDSAGGVDSNSQQIKDRRKRLFNPSSDETTVASLLTCRVRPIPCRRPIPDTIGRSYTDSITDTGLYIFFVLKMRFCAGIGVCRLYMYAGYMRENKV